MNNFEFLKTADKNLYEIISDAEKLYRDEYFEQCIAQTRRFGENVCKNVLGSARTTEKTFDDMLATLKDKSQKEVEKEFIDDLYFLKKCGNQSVHASSVKQNAIDALECLQRSFEVAINYIVYNKNGDKNVLDLHYDIELLATGKRDKTLEQKYKKAKEKARAKSSAIRTAKKTAKAKTEKNTKNKTSKQQTSMKSCKKPTGISPYWLTVGIFSIIAFCLILFLIVTK